MMGATNSLCGTMSLNASSGGTLSYNSAYGSGITVSKSTNTLTLANGTGNQCFVYAIIFNGSITTAS